MASKSDNEHKALPSSSSLSKLLKDAKTNTTVSQSPSTASKPKPQKKTSQKLTVFVDLDGTIVDTDKAVFKALKEHPKYPEFKDELDKVEKEGGVEFPPTVDVVAKHIMAQPGFFANLEPIPGAIEALKAMQDKYGYDVWFLTAPVKHGIEECVKGKMLWVKKHFDLGKETGDVRWVDKVIIMKKKRFIGGGPVRGHFVLIDDTEQGVEPQIYFKGRRNAHLEDVPRIHSWATWETDFLACLPSIVGPAK